MDQIVVTPRSLSAGGHPLLDRIAEEGYQLVFPSPGRQPDEAQLSRALSGAVGYLAGVETISAEVLSGAPSLRVISRNGTGTDNIDLQKAQEMGIIVRRAEGANARGVAELAIGHILAGVRHIPEAVADLKSGHWGRTKGFELEGKVLGLLGCGKIGQFVARFALALDMKVVAFDPFPDSRFSPSQHFSYESFDTVLSMSDVITLHAPPPKDGRPLIDAKALSQMKWGIVLVNTARETLVDRNAIGAALNNGQVAIYTTDAFDREPPADWSLIHHEHVLATPHIGGFTTESIDRATEVAVENLLESLRERSRS